MIPSGTKFVGINPDFPTAERKSAQNNAAQEVYTIENILSGATLQAVTDEGDTTSNNITLLGGAAYYLDNGSIIRQGSFDRFGLNGIEIVCSEDKRIQFVNGVEYYYPSSGGDIVHANSMNGDTPDSSYDETQGFKVGSFFNSLALGITYVCTDQTEGSATWLPLGGTYTPTLAVIGGAVLDVSPDTAFYTITNGVVEVTIYGSVELDFSVGAEGTFSFTLPVPEISSVYGTISLDTPELCNGIVRGDAKILSKDYTFVSASVGFVAKFTYQAY